MQTIADATTLKALVERLRQLEPDTPRGWGTLTAGEMLCHLGDAHESVLGIRIPPGPQTPGVPRPVFKWLALYAPVPWRRGERTRPGVNPKVGGTRPGNFEQDRERAIGSLNRLAVAPPTSLPAGHFLFGPMSARDWHRWAFRHVNHHLQQFGL